MPEHAKLDKNTKVVHLEPESQRIVRAKIARLPAIIHAVHDKGKFLVLGLLKNFFDQADDSLFELADKAQSNQEQNLYFDSMREVRVQRRGIEKHFGDAVDLAFAELVSPEQTIVADEEYARSFTPETLSLVDNDELEEMVALDAAVARANQGHGEAIQLISLRMDSLVPVKVYQKNNPFGADVLCSAFMAEIKKLDVGIKAKLVLFKLFDKSVVGKLADVYGPLNEIFKENNILPSLSQATQQRRRKTDQVTLGVPSVSDEVPIGDPGALGLTQESSVSPEVLSTLKNLLGDKVLANPTAPSQTQVAANQLISLLSRVQHMPSIMDSRVALNVRSLLSQLQQQTGVQASIGRIDDQVMNLVNMLFDFILEERNLAPPMKALISRMQIPIIKVAVADKSFFTKGGHVARRLLNEMATAAIGWSGDEEACKRDPLYKKIESIVRRLIEEFETDLAIFSELLADFSAFLEKEKKRAAVLERRTIDAEDGKAKAEVARTTVALEVEVRTIGQQLPKVVDDLIGNAWSNVLFVTALKYGYESDEWNSHLTVLEDLVWSVKPPKTLEHRQKLIKMVPALLKKLRAGLDTISYNPFDMSDLFKALEKVHISCIRGKKQAEAKIPVKSESRAQPAVQDRSETNLRHQPPKTVFPNMPEPSLSDLAKGVQLSEIESRDSAGPAPPRKPHTEPEVKKKSIVADDHYMGQVKSFVQGAWFDMKDEKGDNVRCRLAAFIKPTGKYIFVNRSGMKVAEKTQEELAIALKNNALSALDNSMLFDRALETVVSSLRRSQ